MSRTDVGVPTPRNTLRLWPGVVIVTLQGVVRYLVPAVAPPDTTIFGTPVAIVAVLGGVAGGLAIVIWWLFFSRALWLERVGTLALMIAALIATSRVVHPSISNGMMGMMLPIFAIPVLSLALVAGAAIGSRLSNGLRVASMVVAILLACGVFTLLRTGGITGEGASDLHWRWTPSPEDRLLAEVRDEPLAPTRAEPPLSAPSPTPAEAPAETRASEMAAPASSLPAASASAATPATNAPDSSNASVKWPGFRGPERDGVIRGVRIATDWSASPPVQLWRRPIGPGWSSFAVRGDLLYTQEQRGEDEIVAAYSVTTGEPVWRHHDPVRFWESNGGAGPRGTPTVSGNRVFAFGATGILNALDAGNGTLIWSRNVASDTGRRVPDWGFASSPLVVDDVAIVAASGTLAAYEIATGQLRWSGPVHGGSYSSPHRATIDGVPQIVLLNGAGATSVAPADGTLLWEHEWPGTTIVQPALTTNGELLISTSTAAGGAGMRRVLVNHRPEGWTIEERWTSQGLKPYFNDYIVHKGHAFGFDGSILACIDLEDGNRKWKGGRYGHGQMVLLPDQDVLLVLSEDGELALVDATPERFRELARFPAIEGKTWNHPALIGDVLLVRNGEEMAAFRLSLVAR